MGNQPVAVVQSHLHTNSTVEYSTHLHTNSTVQYTFTHKQYNTVQSHLHTNSTQNNTINLGRLRVVPCLCELYHSICLTTEEISRINLSYASRRVPVGTMKTEYTEQSIHNNKTT